ncbi:MAG TPA: hypothetical protein VFW75_03430 [Acetobacteraceae bacterium]|nr:hypothetical protein [Acetobacteraceae bacterium]
MKRVILLDERVRATSEQVKELSQEIRDVRERIIRIEAILEIALRDGGIRNHAAAADPVPPRRLQPRP